MSEVNTQTTSPNGNNANVNTQDTTKDDEVVSKKLLEKANREAADYKKKWKALLDDQAKNA